MLNRNALMVVAGAAIFALDATSAAAQDTTRTRPRPTSTKRIPVSKEAPGEVTVRTDTVMVYRTDTLQLPGRTDTVVKTNTVVRVDSVMMPIPRLRQIGGFYFGVDGGSSVPGANFNDSDHPGWQVDGLVGVDPIGSWIGGRLSLGYSQYSAHDFVSQFVDDAKILTVGGDVKLRAVTFTPFAKRVQIYGLAGGSYNRFKNILENDHGVFTVGDVGQINGQFVNVDNSWHHGWGWDAGGGAEMGWGITTVFVEARYSRFNGVNTKIARVPLVIGLSWY